LANIILYVCWTCYSVLTCSQLKLLHIYTHLPTSKYCPVKHYLNAFSFFGSTDTNHEFAFSTLHRRSDKARQLIQIVDLHLYADFSWQPHIKVVTPKRRSKRLYFLKQLKHTGVPHTRLFHYYLVIIRPV